MEDGGGIDLQDSTHNVSTIFTTMFLSFSSGIGLFFITVKDKKNLVRVTAISCHLVCCSIMSVRFNTARFCKGIFLLLSPLLHTASQSVITVGVFTYANVLRSACTCVYIFLQT